MRSCRGLSRNALPAVIFITTALRIGVAARVREILVVSADEPSGPGTVGVVIYSDFWTLGKVQSPLTIEASGL